MSEPNRHLTAVSGRPVRLASGRTIKATRLMNLTPPESAGSASAGPSAGPAVAGGEALGILPVDPLVESHQAPPVLAEATRTFYSNDFMGASSHFSMERNEIGHADIGTIARSKDGQFWRITGRNDSRQFDEENEMWFSETTLHAQLATAEEVTGLEKREEASRARRVEARETAAARRRVSDLPAKGRVQTMTQEDPPGATRLVLRKTSEQTEWAYLHTVDGRDFVSFRSYDSDWWVKDQVLTTYPATPELVADVRRIADHSQD